MDRSALVAFYERYQQQLYRFCFSIVGNAEDAQDALQNTMVKALRALPGERRQIQLKPWLYRIAHNESIDLLRRRRDEAQIDPELLVAAGNPEETAATRERLRRLLADLAELPERQREALVMRELAGLGFAEIGEAFGTSPAVARQTVYEARLSLHQLEAGREMRCEEVMRQISDADGRMMRRRDIKSHLRSCADCRRFRDAIEGRSHDLAAIAPLPAAASAGILSGLLAGASAGGAGGAGAAGAIGVGAGKVAAGSVVVKSVATVAVVAAVGVGAADRGGLIDARLPGGAEQVQEATPRQPPASIGTTTEPVSAPATKQHVSGGQAATKKAGRRAPGAAGTPPSTAAPPAPSSDAAPASLPPAADHGQEVAASHGGGRGNGQPHGKAKGQSKGPSEGHKSPSHPAHSAHPPRGSKPTAGKPAQPAKSTKSKKSPSASEVGPDIPPGQTLKPPQPPKSQGATGAAGGSLSKEAR